MIRELAQTSDHIIKVINELQENIMQVRMIPIGSVFSRFPRMVRDLAQTQKKKIDFIIRGEETELDRSLIEQVRDPLIHLLRNAVDHGIEPQEKRKAANKPETAVIRLSAEREQSHIVITVEDDGGGIAASKIRDSAIKKGFISTEKAESLTEAETINLIFLAGMSTAKKTTEVSGRGVGLDVVRTNVENLSGTMILDTKPGQGSKFTIRLPLTVAIIQGLLVSAGGIIYVFPLASVAETVIGSIKEMGGPGGDHRPTHVFDGCKYVFVTTGSLLGFYQIGYGVRRSPTNYIVGTSALASDVQSSEKWFLPGASPAPEIPHENDLAAMGHFVNPGSRKNIRLHEAYFFYFGKWSQFTSGWPVKLVQREHRARGMNRGMMRGVAR